MGGRGGVQQNARSVGWQPRSRGRVAASTARYESSAGSQHAAERRGSTWSDGFPASCNTVSSEHRHPYITKTEHLRHRVRNRDDLGLVKTLLLSTFLDHFWCCEQRHNVVDFLQLSRTIKTYNLVLLQRCDVGSDDSEFVKTVAGFEVASVRRVVPASPCDRCETDTMIHNDLTALTK